MNANNSSKGEIKVLGIDLAKNSFQLHGVDDKGKTVCRKTFSRAKMIEFIAQRIKAFCVACRRKNLVGLNAGRYDQPAGTLYMEFSGRLRL